MTRRDAVRRLLLTFGAVMLLAATSCAGDGSTSSADGAGPEEFRPAEPPVDPDPLTFDALDAAMDTPVTVGGVSQTMSVSVDGRPALVGVLDLRTTATEARISAVPELVGLDVEEFGDVIDRVADEQGFVHDGTLRLSDGVGLFGYQPATVGFPLTFEDFNTMRYVEGVFAPDQIQPMPATYGELWHHEGLAPNGIPGEYVVFTFQGSRDLGGMTARRYELSVDEEAVAAAGASIDTAGYPLTIWVDEQDILRQVTSAPTVVDGRELIVELSIIHLDEAAPEPPADARPVTLAESEFALAPPDPLPEEHRRLVAFSTALEAAVDAFSARAPLAG